MPGIPRILEHNVWLSADFEVLDAADTTRIPIPDTYSFKFLTEALLISEENVDVIYVLGAALCVMILRFHVI